MTQYQPRAAALKRLPQHGMQRRAMHRERVLIAIQPVVAQIEHRPSGTGQSMQGINAMAKRLHGGAHADPVHRREAGRLQHQT